MTKKKIIRLTESQLKRVISESIKKMLNEIGDTNRGQYMLGRLHRRHNTDADYLSGVDSQARKFNKGNWEVFDQGYNDEGISNALDKSNTIRRNYGVYKMNDMDKVGRKFIEFIEKNDLALQLIVDYMSGNQNGTKYSSPLPELIPQFEDEALGYECSNEMKKAIEKAFNEWWYYAESQLMPEEMNESKKKTVKLTESQLKRVISESVKKVLSNIDMTEGKTVNNKHIFNKGVFGLAKPGEKASTISNCEFFKTKGYKTFQDAKKAVESGELSKEIFDKWIDDLRKGLKLHNTRTDKYDTTYYGGSIPNWGRAADVRRFDDRMRSIKYKHDMKKLTESVWDKWLSEDYEGRHDFLKKLRPSDILNGDVDEFIRDRQFWCDIELDYDYLLPALDTRMAMLDKKWAWDKIEDENNWFKSLTQKYEKTLNNNKESQISSAWDEHEKETFPKKKGFFGHFTYADTDDIIKAFDNRKRNVPTNLQKAIHNGRNPDTQKLHTKGSANRDLIAIDKQRTKNKKDE